MQLQPRTWGIPIDTSRKFIISIFKSTQENKVTKVRTNRKQKIDQRERSIGLQTLELDTENKYGKFIYD